MSEQHATQLIERALGIQLDFADGFNNPKVVETHVSVVIIGDTLVLKFKKAVDLGFVDHRDIETRWTACRDEVILNRRLSEGVYLGLLRIPRASAITISTDIVENGLESAADSETCVPDHEPAVVMRRLPDQMSLASILRTTTFSHEKHLKPLAKALSDFHQAQRRTAQPAAHYVKELYDSCIANIEELESHTNLLPTPYHAILQRLREYTEHFFSEHEATFLGRANASHFIDGHGDLRTEHVYYCDGKTQIIDCIEFSESLRRVDTLNDIAFLCMDFDHTGRTDCSISLLDAYAAYANEAVDKSLLLFYQVYRALVRAKVAILRATQVGADNATETESYLSLASRYERGFEGPFLCAVGGLMGTGKSTLSDRVAALTGARVIRSDELRHQIFGRSSEDKSLGYGQGKYSTEAGQHVYAALIAAAESELQHMQPVILDAAFITSEQRHLFWNLARSAKVPSLFAMCELARETTLERLALREKSGASVSDGRGALYDDQLSHFEPLEDQERNYSSTVDTSKALEENTDIIIARLQEQLTASAHLV